MAAVSATRPWARTTLLAASILAVGLARQYANADGVFQPNGFMQLATASVRQWWNELSQVDDAAAISPTEATAAAPQLHSPAMAIPAPFQASPPSFAGAPVDSFTNGPYQQYGCSQGWPVRGRCR